MSLSRLLPLLALLTGVADLSAATVFSNQSTKVAPGTPPAQPVEMTLAAPTLITSIRTRHLAAVPGAKIRVLANNQPVWEGPVAETGRMILTVQPYVVFPAGTYRIETTSAGTWVPLAEPSRPGITEVRGDPIPASRLGAVQAALRSSAGRPVALSTVIRPPEITKKQDLAATVGNQTGGGPSSGRAFTGPEFATKETPGTGGDGPKRPGLGLTNGVTLPGNQRDTFGASRVPGAQGVDDRNFAGTGAGQTSSGEPTAGSDEADLISMIQGMISDAGGTVTGDPTKDAAEAAYMQSVGSDGYAATKDMSQSERKAYWEKTQSRQMVGADTPSVSYPNEGDTLSGGNHLFGTPGMRRAMVKFQAKAIDARKGAAGGKQTEAGGGPMRKGGNGQDQAEREAGVGTINWNEVLQINQLVNPGAR